MSLEKKDFVEIEFTGKIKDGEIFDSNIREDVAKLHEGHTHPIETKPFVFCLGEGMFLQAIDDFLIGKPDTPETYEIALSPENAFGKRDTKLIQMIPLKIFIQSKLNPSIGAMFNFDGKIAKVLAVSGGRVMVDFNNPLAGKDVVYKIRILRKIDKLAEKVKSFIEFLFKRDLKFEIKDNKIILEVEKPAVDFVKLFSEKFKDLFGLELEIKEVELKELIEHVHNHE
ncbi:MAG: FKBP-type peptidyl-prolyl cis-trans isomerase [Nanoarchaeota archaeon]|nr:FKBP-type peptidyl-prolyl cis-trans isomerase [Nanoarchaeota archaeon]